MSEVNSVKLVSTADSFATLPGTAPTYTSLGPIKILMVTLQAFYYDQRLRAKDLRCFSNVYSYLTKTCNQRLLQVYLNLSVFVCPFCMNV